MAVIEVLGGDFIKHAQGSLRWGALRLKTLAAPDLGETIPLSQVAAVEIAPPDSLARPLRAAGLGILGGLAFGLFGALAGLWAGGARDEVVFQVKFKDGRRLVAAASSWTFSRLRAAAG